MEISQRNRRALLAAGVALVLFVLFRFAVFPMWDGWQEGQANLALQERTLQKYREAARTLELRSAETASLEARLREAEAGLLDSETVPLASAELQERMKQLTAARLIEVPTSAFLPPKPLGAEYLEVPLRLQFPCRLDQLVNFLEDIQKGPKSFDISRLLIQAANPREKQISVHMDVAGIMRAAVPPGKERPE